VAACAMPAIKPKAMAREAFNFMSLSPGLS